MIPSFLKAWRGPEWAILSPGSSPAYREAACILERGLAAFGIRASRGENASSGENGERPAIILNASGHGSQGYAIRLGRERMEFFGDSETALPFAAAAFLEALGRKSLSPLFTRFAAPDALGESAILRSAPAFASRSLVLREAPPPDQEGAWGEWALRRGFDSLDGPETEWRLSTGRAARDAALDSADARSRRGLPGSRGPIAVADMEAGDAVRALLSLEDGASGARRAPEGSPRILLRAGGFPAFAAAYLASEQRGKRPPLLVVDDGERCRAHPLGDPACPRNAGLFGDAFARAAARWREAGGRLILRSRYDDDLLSPAPCPLQASLIAPDLEWAAEMGFSGLEYLASSRLPERPSLNAWVYSSLAFPPPVHGRGPSASARERGEAARSAFYGALLGKESPVDAGEAPPAEPRAALLEYSRLLEESVAAAFDRAPGADAAPAGSLAPLESPIASAEELLRSLPPSVLDPWDEGLSRHEERAQALSDSYPKLDRCAELLGPAEEGAEGIAAVREGDAFRAQEAAIELSGVMRALYAEAQHEGGSPAALAMVADGALAVLERKLKELYAPRPLPRMARRFLLTAYRFRIAGLYYRRARGPIARLRALAFRAGLSSAYRRLSHPQR